MLGLAPGVGELDAGGSALLLMKRAMRVRSSTCRPSRCPCPPARSGRGLDRGGFDEHQPGPADRAAAEVDQVPVVGEAVDARILAHRRDGDAVAQGQAAKGKRVEEHLTIIADAESRGT